MESSLLFAWNLPPVWSSPSRHVMMSSTYLSLLPSSSLFTLSPLLCVVITPSVFFPVLLRWKRMTADGKDNDRSESLTTSIANWRGRQKHRAHRVLWQQNSHTAVMHILINTASIEGVWTPEFSFWNFTNSLEFQCLLHTADQTRPFFILFHVESKTVPQTLNLCSPVLHQQVQIQRKSTFYPQNIFLCVVWISERTAATSPHSTNSRICTQWRRSVDIVTYKLNLTEIQVNVSLLTKWKNTSNYKTKMCSCSYNLKQDRQRTHTVISLALAPLFKTKIVSLTEIVFGKRRVPF